MRPSDITISVIIPTMGRESLYPLVEALLRQRSDYPFEIILVPQVDISSRLPESDIIRVIREKPGKGIPYYRNKGVSLARGQVVAFIDDDELPLDDQWLEKLTRPIIERKVLVTTSGNMVPTGQGLVADAISSLGYPGGGSVGFRSLWKVDERDITDHLCSGNFAIDRNLLLELGCFDEKLSHGCEDVELASRLTKRGHEILYAEDATVLHEPRKRIMDFILWHVRRGKSYYEYHTYRGISRDLVSDRLKASSRTIRQQGARRGLLSLAFLLLQYLAQLTGFVWHWWSEKAAASTCRRT